MSPLSRVPDVSAKPTVINRLSQFRDAGLVITSYCSAGAGHSHVVDYAQAIAELGDVEVDYQFKRSRACPICGAPGGGVAIEKRV